jgi:hypothetical protein
MEPARQRRVSFGPDDLGPTRRSMRVDLDQRPTKAILKGARKAAAPPEVRLLHSLKHHDLLDDMRSIIMIT